MFDKPIISFSGQYSFLSNFSPSPLKVNGLDFATVEHAYQAYKATNNRDRLLIQCQLTAGKAKRVGRSIEMNKDFDERKLFIMARLLKAKFQFNNDLGKKLLDTGDAPLVEGNYWCDNFWGDCVCRKCSNIEGINHLGLLLEARRKELLS